ncbi:sensor histidine kinase [Vulgatibacter incomptus]|uniref:histidine kinase n=1 Tax=Vulgatibacter incomptus TaxID=1391653 RepID=A0A0K1PDZ0_9BACT|nr:HAMP domain-containing sensor histidine kinase [Vulgatibacter incomptus]AKU91725.1 Osmosensitive K+ channel histidine kinase kdpD [Vulgatibacter incomptus]
MDEISEDIEAGSEESERLLLERAEAGERSRTREELLGIASHDLRSPLANIRSYAGMILMGRGAPLDPRVKRAAQVIAKNADRGLRQIDDLVDLLRAESGHLELDRDEAPLDELLRVAFEEARQPAQEREVSLEWAAPGDLPTVNVDGDKLRRAVRALLDAAVRRAPQGSTVRLTADARKDEIQIAVDDEGDRPDRDEVQAAFDWETQAVASHKLAAGVSLALAKEVAKAHGGRAGVIPGASVGSTWFLVVPKD